MATSATTTSRYSTIQSGIVPGLCPGIANLDSPLAQQTKAEIRSLVSEIADLANRKIEPAEFYRGMLPRVCLAMGATGACVWKTTAEPRFSIVAQHAFPPTLSSDGVQPSEPHRRILECIFAEGGPVLVPPGSINLEVARPTNPLDEALLVVPVRIDDSIDYLLEVVQRPGGGPVAQRGYLRFVAQMADLMADFLRRDSLRSLTDQQRYVARFQRAFVAVAGCTSQPLRFKLFAAVADELLEAQQTILLKSGLRYRVQAIGGIETLDPRSETVLLSERVANRLTKSLGESGDSPQAQATYGGRQSIGPPALVEIHPQPDGQLFSWQATDQATAMQLCEILGAERLFALPLQADRFFLALLPFGNEAPSDLLEQRSKELATAFGPLFDQSEGYLARILAKLHLRQHRFAPNRHAPISFYARVQRWVFRLAAVGLAVAIAAFPMPQQITVTALLEPIEKQSYYAPAAALIDAVYVEESSAVTRGDVLLELVDQQLQAQIDQLLGQQTETRSQMAHIKSSLSRNAQLPALQRDQLEAQNEQLTVEASTLGGQVRILQSRLSELRIIARQDGEIASWDLRNRLTARPVQAGQLLLTTFRPDGPWRLQLSIPEHRVGLISQAIASGDSGARVRFSLSGHPGETLGGRVTQLGSQTVRDAAGQTVVLASARIESEKLPFKKDGAAARATIDCGRVPAIWLVLRDAIWAVSSRLKMIW